MSRLVNLFVTYSNAFRDLSRSKIGVAMIGEIVIKYCKSTFLKSFAQNIFYSLDINVSENDRILAIPISQRAPGYKWSNSTTFYLVQMQDLVTVVAGTVGDVYPSVPGLVDKLVKSDAARLLQLHNLIEQAFVVGSGADGNIGCLSLDMLGRGDTANGAVQGRRTIAAINRNWSTPRSPYRVQQLLNKPLHT